MNKRLAKSAIAIGVGLWLSGTALAAPVDIANTRPFALNAGGLASVQSHLDTLYGTGVLDAMGDQSSAAQWQITGGGIGGIGPILQFQSGAYSAAVGFGIWSATDTSSITKTLIFSGAQGPGATATVTWAAGSPGTAIIDSSDNALDGSYAGINRTRFGFYIASPDGDFYSADQLNPGGLAQMVAYNKLPENNWALFYEDLNCSVGCDGNFVDMVVTSESMVAAVPEPETYAMLLAGLGLMGFVARRRQRKLAAA